MIANVIIRSNSKSDCYEVYLSFYQDLRPVSCLHHLLLALQELWGQTKCEQSGIQGQVRPVLLEKAAAASLVSEVKLIGTSSPVIQATATTDEGFNGETYILTGATSGTAGVDRTITEWTESGTGCSEGYC